ncbi:MAG TPA: RdgB/HAM1 family non-canonical purine NTP pyrophosphatase [Jiangellaceae bacterium]|nr:RdgB/HAM1 family non-canonical purine NTP pyrophosphatase [Jiangellaceae bacterium]
MSPERVVLATGNRHKVDEVARILVATGARVELVGADDVGGMPGVAETGATFAENALLKARAVAELNGLPALADDSGLSVDALNGMPGVLSARWSGLPGADAENTKLVLAQLVDTPDERRGAAFVCAAVLVQPDGTEAVQRREVRGRLLREPRGSGGFGYDPIFVPEGEERTTAELDPAAKDALSHRGRAFRALAVELGWTDET